MDIKENIIILCNLLQSKGWEKVNNNEKLITLENNLIFTEKVSLVFPIDKTAKNFPLILTTNLSILIQIDSQYKFIGIVNVIFAQAKNMKNKFSIKKKDWILSEPDSKYNINEIPDIYIPNNNIFE